MVNHTDGNLTLAVSWDGLYTISKYSFTEPFLGVSLLFQEQVSQMTMVDVHGMFIQHAKIVVRNHSVLRKENRFY